MRVWLANLGGIFSYQVIAVGNQFSALKISNFQRMFDLRLKSASSNIYF